MRRTLAFLAALCLALAAPTRPSHAAVLWNLGDFENGSMAGWSVTQWSSNGDNAYWDASDDGTFSPWSSHPVYPPSGTFQAVSDIDGAYATSILYREFLVPATADTLKLRFWYRGVDVSDMPTLAPGGQGQGVRVDLMNATQPVTGMAGIFATMFATSFPTNAANDVAPRTLALGVQAWRGQTVRLRIAVAHNTAPMITGVDDVRLEGAQFVEVATSLPGLRDGAARWGDIDDDGDLDVALMGSNGTSNVTGIWRNTAGTFALVSSAPTSLRAGDLEWLDVDRDGDLDLYVTGLTASLDGTAWWATNLGGGTFSWASTSIVGYNSNLSIADADADGDADLLVGSRVAVNVLSTGDAPATVTNAVQFGNSLYALLADSLLMEWGRGILPGFSGSGRPVFYPTYSSLSAALFSNADGGRRFELTHMSGGSETAAGVRSRSDADGDGIEELFSAGRDNLSGLYSRISRPTLGDTIPDDVPPLYQPFAAWSDLDADGDQDLLVGGNDGTNRYTRVHRWQSLRLTASNDGLPALQRGACAVGDFDADGDADVLLLGDGASGPVTKLLRNVISTPNLPPSAPPTPLATTDASTVRLTCGNASDDHTLTAGLSYNFRAGGTPGGVNVVCPASNATSGRRQVVRTGNSNASNLPRYDLLWSHLGATHSGTVYWAAQAVDGAGSGGAWSAESRVNVGGWPAAVTDVSGDQGGQVRVRVAAGLTETVAAPVIIVSSYVVWQRVDSPALSQSIEREATSLAAVSTESAAKALATVSIGERRYLTSATATAAGFPTGTWEAVATVPALQQSEYLVRVPTVADSGASGAHWSVFVVTTHTPSPTVWWASAPDSGKSLDNIAPGVPQGLAAQYHTGSGNRLTWLASADDDFQYFRIYRGNTPGFAISPATLAANTASAQWSDATHDAPGVYYKVTAVDYAGNESLAATPGSVTDVDVAPELAFALTAPSPNPFMRSTRLSFTLPRAQGVTLEVFDASGRRVRTLAEGPFAAGAHELSWDGRNESGAQVGAGLMFVRLRAGGHEAVRRVVSMGDAR